MNKQTVNGLFQKTLEIIESCCDLQIKDQCGVTKELGMCLNDEVSFTHVLATGTIALYVNNNRVLEFDEKSLILTAFRELLEEVYEQRFENVINLKTTKKKEETVHEVSVAIRDMLEEIMPNILDEYIKNNGKVCFDTIESMVSCTLSEDIKNWGN